MQVRSMVPDIPCGRARARALRPLRSIRVRIEGHRSRLTPWTMIMLVFYLCGSAPAAASFIDRVSVIDGDTLELRGQRIRLHGVDAPESPQLCTREGAQVRCGQQAALALDERIGQRTVSCKEKDRDRYRRSVAVCTADGEDLNRWLVLNGWALAYRQYADDHVQAEREAAQNRRGIWGTEFTPPWEWRHTAGVIPTQSASPMR